MTTHRIDSNETFVTEVTVCESNRYSDLVFVKFARHNIPEDIYGMNEMFISPIELYELGQFLIQQAEIINGNYLKRQDIDA